MTGWDEPPLSFQDLLAVVERLRRATDSNGEGARAAADVPGAVGSGRQEAPSEGGSAGRRRMSADQCWVPRGRSVEVRGHVIAGMVYVGEGLRDQSGVSVENCLINPKLPVATRIEREATGAAYAPSYSLLSPSDRLGYLRWLASDRSDPNVAPPFLRLYFFGLERRLMLDDPSEDERADLIAELERLQRIYSEDYGLDEDVGHLLDCVAALTPERIKPDPGRMVDFDGYRLPPWLAAGLGFQVAQGKLTDGAWLLCWWLAQPGTRLRVAQRRVFDEFAALFPLRFAKRYPGGLKVEAPSATGSFAYLAASGTFERSLSMDLSWNPGGPQNLKPLRIAQRIAAECWKDLGPYVRFVGRKPAQRDTVDAHVLLPTDLATQRTNAGLRRLHEWAGRHLDWLDHEVSISDALRVLEGKDAISASKPRLVVLSSALALGGIALAPDARFTRILPKARDRAVLFKLPRKASKPADMSPRYLRMLYVMQLVVFVAKAGGAVSEAKWQAMDAMIQRRARLRAADKTRLRADLRWLARRREGKAAITKRCRMLQPKELDEARDLAVRVACADGVVDPAQVKAVQTLYAAMGRSQDDVFANLHRRSAKSGTGQAPERVAARRPFGYVPPRTGGQLPSRVPKSVDLDDGRISRIVADTREVSEVLSNVFREEEPETAPAWGAADAAEQRAVFEGLDPAHSALVERLLQRPSWSGTDFERLAKRSGLMVGGALEAINEWSFERFGDALLEEDADLMLNPDVVQAFSDETEVVSDATT